jgi:hydrogenase expression/formation protein HypE
LDKILLGHGSGGGMTHELISRHFAPAFQMEDLLDSAVLEGPRKGERLAFTTDSHVVSPLFFPGGNIGVLAVNGTVNDLAMVGARPLCLSAGFILEEGFCIDELRSIIASMAGAAREAGVRIAAGDTKVVERGKADGVFINTSGVGIVPEGVLLSPARIEPGDKIIMSGRSGNHGVAVMAERNGLSFDPPVLSDTAALNGLAEAVLPWGMRAMRDPTRGGVATALKELALQSGLSMTIEEELIPVAPGVRGACDLLGLDHLYVANEGVLLAVVRPDMAEYVETLMHGHPRGKYAAVIGHVEAEPGGVVILRTAIGGRRLLAMLEGGQMPRIC